MGICFKNGDGVKQDYAEAVNWLILAAEQNDPKAQFHLGVCSFNGEGMPKDSVEAYAWWNLAAETYEASAEQRWQTDRLSGARNLAAEIWPWDLADGSLIGECHPFIN
jgi:TPR repeat protein